MFLEKIFAYLDCISSGNLPFTRAVVSCSRWRSKQVVKYGVVRNRTFQNRFLKTTSYLGATVLEGPDQKQRKVLRVQSHRNQTVRFPQNQINRDRERRLKRYKIETITASKLQEHPLNISGGFARNVGGRAQRPRTQLGEHGCKGLVLLLPALSAIRSSASDL